MEPKTEENVEQELENATFGASVSLLRGVCELADEVDGLGARRPQDAPAASKKQRAMCLVCPHNPSRVFPRLNTVLLEDVASFHGGFKASVGALMTFTPPNETCLNCASQSVSDFEVLYLRFEKFVRNVIAKGFRAEASEAETAQDIEALLERIKPKEG